MKVDKAYVYVSNSSLTSDVMTGFPFWFFGWNTILTISSLMFDWRTYLRISSVSIIVSILSKMWTTQPLTSCKLNDSTAVQEQIFIFRMSGMIRKNWYQFEHTYIPVRTNFLIVMFSSSILTNCFFLFISTRTNIINFVRNRRRIIQVCAFENHCAMTDTLNILKF